METSAEFGHPFRQDGSFTIQASAQLLNLVMALLIGFRRQGGPDKTAAWHAHDSASFEDVKFDAAVLKGLLADL